MITNNKIRIGVEAPFVLENTDRIWMIVSGEVNVFFTKVDQAGNYKCALKYLYSAKAGEILFSLLTLTKTSDARLIIFSDDANLLPIEKSALLEVDNFFLKNMVNIWIIKIAAALNSANSPRIYDPLDDFLELKLNKDRVAFPSNNLKWIRLKSGSLSVFSDEVIVQGDDKFNYPIPVCKKLWIRSLDNNTILEVLSTRQVIEEDINFLIALDHLQIYFYNQLVRNIESHLNDEKLYFNEKFSSEEVGLTNSLKEITSVVSGDDNLEPQNTNQNSSRNSLLFSTCQFIGKNIGFSLKEPKQVDSLENSVTNQLFSIAKSSNVRVRKVILRGVWWKVENGHLLAFTKNEKIPVALIQKKTDRYLIKNLQDGSEKIVDSEIAENLEPIGYMFFAGFDCKMNSIKKVLNFAMNGSKKDLNLLLLASLIGSVLGLLIPILTGVMFDDVIPTADKSLHFEVFIILLMIGVISAGLQLIQGVLQLRVESKSSINLQAGVMDHILRLPVKFYKNYTAGDLTNRVLSINSIRQILSNTLITAALSGAFSFVNLALLFYYDSSLAWVGVVLGLIAAVFMITMGLLKLKYDRKVSEYQGELQGFLFEFLSGITKIRLTGGERRIFALWSSKFSRLKKLGFNSGSYQNFVEIFNSSYPLLTSIFFFSFIYYTMMNATTATSIISVGAFMAFITAFNKFLNDSLRLSMAFITSLNVIPLYERVKPILEAETESTEGASDPGDLAGEIEINSLSFRYNEDQPLILKDISIKIKQGEMIAFVGSSGSGKSTVMRLLLGFETPEVGSIYYDGSAFDTMNKELVRRQIGVVLQNGTLMSGSIFQNIIGNSELTLEDAWEAARMAGMEEDIKQMPMEMHTVVSEGAGTFSGGQKQRLMIARAIAHKPRILFMDEATSALDNKTQNIVSESLDKLQATRIVIAHRLSTIKNADKIYVMDKGQVVEGGTYEELMKLEGLFSKLAKRQIA